MGWTAEPDAELVTALVTRLVSRRGRALLLEGPAGIGTSTLGAAMARRLGADGFRVIPVLAEPALRHIPLEDREAFKYALAATLVKNNAHWRSFETVFEVYFSLRGSKYGIDDDSLDADLADLLDDDERDGPGEGGQGEGG